MNFNCARLLFRSSSILIKHHCRKSSKKLPIATIPASHISSQLKHFSTEKVIDEDINDEFESFDDIRPDYQDVNVDEVTDGDPQLIKTLRLCQLEIDMLYQSGENVPKVITPKSWRQIIGFSSKSQRLQFLRFLWLKEIKRVNGQRKKLIRHEKYLESKAIRGLKERIEVPTNAPMKYGLSDITLVHRLRDVKIKEFYNFRLLQAMMYGPHIIVDCDYERYMNYREIQLCAKQVLLMWAENRENYYPYDVIFCNLQKDSPMLQKVRTMLPNIDTDPAFPFNYTEKHYLDLFPKERLVYLTPHCRNTLNKFDGNDIYIIGGIVDKSNSEPVSFAKAKREGIRYAQLPLDLHLNWKLGVKSLTLNQVLGIMNDVKNGHDWKYAFRHVPSRKLNDRVIDDELKERREIRHSAKSIREQYRRNIVYDLLLNKK